MPLYWSISSTARTGCEAGIPVNRAPFAAAPADIVIRDTTRGYAARLWRRRHQAVRGTEHSPRRVPGHVRVLRRHLAIAARRDIRLAPPATTLPARGRAAPDARARPVP